MITCQGNYCPMPCPPPANSAIMRSHGVKTGHSYAMHLRMPAHLTPPILQAAAASSSAGATSAGAVLELYRQRPSAAVTELAAAVDAWVASEGAQGSLGQQSVELGAGTWQVRLLLLPCKVAHPDLHPCPCCRCFMPHTSSACHPFWAHNSISGTRCSQQTTQAAAKKTVVRSSPAMCGTPTHC